jgi:hypothetical protein
MPAVPLTSRERLIFWIVAAVCALSRFAAMARTLWWWDEALFCLGVRSYDVTQHHPHPPGFPIFVGAAKLLRLVIDSDFHALQAIGIAAGMLLFPALYLLARELGFPFTTATVAAALCAFFPNVWFFGGMALSDVPSITLAVFAAAMLLRGRYDVNAYFLGTFALALAIGIRPQNILIGLFPGLLATWHRARVSWRDVLFAAALGTTISVGAYVYAALGTGDPEAWLRIVREHSEYISRVDSFRNPDRPALWRLIDRFFLRQYQSPVLSIVTSIFVAVSAVGAVRQRDRRVLFAVLTFAPVAVLTWMMLDRFSVNRFSIGYAPLFAILAADGIARAARRYEALAGAALIAAFAIWTLPTLTVVRNEKTPPVLAMEQLRKIYDPARDDLYVGFSLSPHVDCLAALPYTRVKDERSLPLALGTKRPLFLSEFEHTEPKGLLFRRAQGRINLITRGYYYDVALRPMTSFAKFGPGWYEGERYLIWESRWMARHSVTELPPVTGPAKLEVAFEVPPEVLSSHPMVTLALNGKVLDRIAVDAMAIDREYDLEANGKTTLEITTTRTRREGERELGVKMKDLVWGGRRIKN